MYDHRDLTNQQTGGNSAGDHGYDDKRRAWFVVGNLTSVLRSNLVNELRLSASHQALDRVLPAGSTSRPEIRFPTVQFGRASNVPQGRSQDNYIVTNATSLNYVAKGTHDLKFGFEANLVPTTSTINQSFNGLFEFLQDRPVVAGDADLAAVPVHAGRRAARRAGGADPRRQHLLGLHQQPVAAGRTT